MLTSFAYLFAHSPTPGLGDFWNGVFHPVVDLEQGFALLALGVACAREETSVERWSAGVAFVALVVTAFLSGWLFRVLPLPPGSALLVAGAMLVRPPELLARWLVVPAALTGFAVGQGIGADLAQPATAWTLPLGFCLGSFAILSYAQMGWKRFQRPWLVIASRILGSWLLAIGLMLVAGHLSGTLPSPSSPAQNKTAPKRARR